MSILYAVAVGRNVGIYETWEECEKQVHGFSHAVYKKFGTMEDAQNFIEQHQGEIKSNGLNWLDETIQDLKQQLEQKQQLIQQLQEDLNQKTKEVIFKQDQLDQMVKDHLEQQARDVRDLERYKKELKDAKEAEIEELHKEQEEEMRHYKDKVTNDLNTTMLKPLMEMIKAKQEEEDFEKKVINIMKKYNYFNHH